MPDRRQKRITLLTTRRLALGFIVFAALVGGHPHAVRPAAAAEDAPRKVFLPLTAANYRNSPPLLLGIYPPVYLGTQSAINSQLKELDNWAGKATRSLAFF